MWRHIHCSRHTGGQICDDFGVPAYQRVWKFKNSLERLMMCIIIIIKFLYFFHFVRFLLLPSYVTLPCLIQTELISSRWWTNRVPLAWRLQFNNNFFTVGRGEQRGEIYCCERSESRRRITWTESNEWFPGYGWLKYLNKMYLYICNDLHVLYGASQPITLYIRRGCTFFELS